MLVIINKETKEENSYYLYDEILMKFDIYETLDFINISDFY